ncbi:uncharacterized protein [Venturia canescens]|uniref:uncharacterized protein n=1 Tax=Venturia canescens TaxID=32260 RepID=UPI001C9CB145|nr:uncharacterized protein LOC122418939 [Venturia canescens]
MEPDMAVELVAKNHLLEDENVYISVFIGDDDASSIAAMRQEVTYTIEKWSDINHAKKNLSNDLYAISLPKRLIDYFTRAFTYALQQNKDKVEETKVALLNIVNHAYENEILYVHNGLPNGEPLTDPNLRAKLTPIFEKYAKNANKLAPCGSSQPNESFNSIVASKHPKNKFYGASESMPFRVAAAVCKKNTAHHISSKYMKNFAYRLGKILNRFGTPRMQKGRKTLLKDAALLSSNSDFLARKRGRLKMLALKNKRESHTNRNMQCQQEHSFPSTS